MTVTDELRHLLTERGVEWTDETVDSMSFQGYFRYTYWGDGGGCCFCEPIGAKPGTLGAMCDFSAIGVTPEQAVTATLGAGTCRLPETCIDHGSIQYNGTTSWRLCSACGAEVLADPANFCPSCGRKVDG